MQFSPLLSDSSPQRCPICHAVMASDSNICETCGTRMDESPDQELRSVIYLLSELARWEAEGLINGEQASALRQGYERRREDLRAQLLSWAERGRPSAPAQADASAQELNAPTTVAIPPAHAAVSGPETQRLSPAATANAAAARAMPLPRRAASAESATAPPKPQRTLIETLADPHTLRLLLYTGAAMFVVGIIIWLRDVLYLKLQEPAVQAALLALGTLAVTASGWYTILRTRQRLTGRALTLIGSLLVPVNFWFLVRSGLINDNGRAWIVCAFCALLYAHTAALLREKLYVYLSCAATVATAWALIFRAEREAFGLYALTLMAASLVFLHLSRLFPLSLGADEEKANAPRSEEPGDASGGAHIERWGYELWGVPLVHAALVGVALCVCCYMPLRLWPSPSLRDGIFRLHANNYDSSIAMLLFAAGAYAAWFTGRYIYIDRRVPLYTLSALALFWTEFLALDGLRLSGSIHLLALAATTLAVAIAARLTQGDALRQSLHRAASIVSVQLAPAAFGVMLAAPAITATHSAAFGFLAITFAVLSTPQLSQRRLQGAFAYLSAAFASGAFLAALISAHLRSETLFVAACALWPFVLYACAALARRQQREQQIITPFLRVANAESALLLLWASSLALLFHLFGTASATNWRPAMLCALFAVVLYGVMRSGRERSAFGSALWPVGALVLVAALADTLKASGVWPGAWPVAAGVICTAFLVQKLCVYLPGPNREAVTGDRRSPEVIVRFIADAACLVCALLWLVKALSSIDAGGFGAASVLLLAWLYWSERAARQRLPLFAHIALALAGALFFTILIALRVDRQWFATAFALLLFPAFIALGRYAQTRNADWLARPASRAASLAAALAFVIAMLQATPHLHVGDPSLLAPCVALAAITLVSFIASLLSTGAERVRYFRAGLYVSVVSFALACLRAGYDPISDVEIYTTPVAALLLVIAYLSVKREWEAYARDTDLLLWAGSILLCAPLLLRALQFRLVLDTPAPWRDVGVLCASLALILFGVLGRLRAPVLVGGATLALELAALALTSVDWLQVPLKYYLITVGALMLLVFWMVEYHREHILLMRSRINERRDIVRERFGEWR